MVTEFEVFTRLVCWGDELKTNELIGAMKLNTSYRVQVKGQEILRGDGSGSGSFAKTSSVSFSYDAKDIEDKRRPDRQLDYVANKLGNLKGDLKATFKVESAELQLSIYYSESREGGETDFLISSKLQRELAKHSIDVRITVLP